MKNSINRVELMLLMRRLADLTTGGMTLHRSVAILRGHGRGSKMESFLGLVQERLEGGQSFSQALAAQNGFFSPLYIGLIEAGESTGNLDSALEESASLLQNEMETSQRIRTALAYPLFLLVVALTVCLFLTVFVIPRFEFLFQDLGQSLPLPTRFLIAFSSFVIHFGWLGLISLAAGLVFGFKKHPEWKNQLRRLVVRLPLISDLMKGIFLQRWSATMASLLKNGFTVADALHLSMKTVGPLWGTHDLEEAFQRITEGQTLKSALEPSPLFPALVCELIGTAEESGRLDEVFARIAASSRQETELRSKLLLSLLEPALIMGMGVVVGFVALAMLLPIFEMSASFR